MTKRPRILRTTALLAGATLLALAVLVAARARRLDRAVAARVEALAAAADDEWPNAAGGEEAPGGVTDADLADLPDPVRRYLDSVLDVDQPRVRSVRLDQRGELRLGEGPGAWKPFRATQHVAVRPPGFLWDATVAVLPLLPARVVDAYEGGEGTLSARLLSTLPVASAGPGTDMDEGELLRYLAESVWYPTALLDDAVEWEAIDDRTARATVEDGENVAALEFRFDERGLVDAVRTEARYRQESADEVPWIGHFGAYEEREGLLVPLAAAVAWESQDGEQPYWRARIESIEFDFVG